MTLDLTCRSCSGSGHEWGTSEPWFNGWGGGTGSKSYVPCPRCDGTGQLDHHQAALDIARSHGTRIAFHVALNYAMAYAKPFMVDLAGLNEPWRARAACADADPELFFPARGESLAAVKRICAACPVQDECAEYALANSEMRGIWGGLSERERRRIRRQRRDESEVA